MFKAHIKGKRIQSCKDHSKNVAKYAAVNAAAAKMEKTAYLSGLLHDTGKYTEEFNTYIENASAGKKVAKGSVIHTFAGVRLILERFHHAYNRKIFKRADSCVVAEIIAAAIGSHHGLFDVYGADKKNGFEHRMTKQPEYDKKAIRNFYENCANEESIDRLFKQAEIEVIDVLSHIKSFSQDLTEMMFYLSLIERMITSAVIDGDRIDTAEFMSDGNYSEKNYGREAVNSIWQAAIECLECQISAFPQETEIDRARREMSDFCASFADEEGGVFRLELPTGGGKTLTSLRYALKHAISHNKQHIIFAVPLLSILDQNAKVIKKAIGNDDIILEHHSNVVLEEDVEKETCSERELLTDSWNAPVIITTLVQFLNTLFDGKTSSIRRFHSLADSVIVIDEVQSVPQKMISMFNLAVNFLAKVCNTTFILCSATQPKFELNSRRMIVDKRVMIPEEKMNEYRKLFKRNTAHYAGEGSLEEIAELATKHLESFRSVLIVCNTKKEAGDIFALLQAQKECCFHLSTSMCMAHRQDTLEEISRRLEKKEQLICVSTQLIEAGVDISFGAVIRLTAGLENIVQAAGRCNRNMEDTEDHPVSIVSLKGENLSNAALKEIKRAQDVTGELIYEFDRNPEEYDRDILSEKAIQYYYERLFRKINAIQGYTDYSVNGVTLMDLLSENRAFVPEGESDYTVRQAFKTAGSCFEVFETQQIPVVVPYDVGEALIREILSSSCQNNIGYMKKNIKEAGRYTVNLFRYQIEKLQRENAIYSDDGNNILFLNPEYYDSSLGVILNIKEENECSMLIL